MKLMVLRFLSGTSAHVKEANEISRRLGVAGVSVKHVQGHTTRGSRTIKLYVQEKDYIRATEVVVDLLPPLPMEVIEENG